MKCTRKKTSSRKICVPQNRDVGKPATYVNLCGKYITMYMSLMWKSQYTDSFPLFLLNSYFERKNKKKYTSVCQVVRVYCVYWFPVYIHNGIVPRAQESLVSFSLWIFLKRSYSRGLVLLNLRSYSRGLVLLNQASSFQTRNLS